MVLRKQFDLVVPQPPPEKTSTLAEVDIQRLKIACESENFDLISQIVDEIPDPGVGDNLELSYALKDAVHNRKDILAIHLISLGVRLSPYSAITAIRNKQFEIVQAAIAHGWDINAPVSPGGLPLLKYILDEFESVQWLLNHGASPNIRGCLDDTPLSHAVMTADIRIVRLLLENGGDVSAGFLLHFASRRNASDRVENLELLYEYGLRESQVNKIQYQDDKGKYLVWIHNCLGTPLHDAVRWGHLDAVEWLLDHGARQIPDPYHQTPNDLAIQFGKADIVRLFASRPDPDTSLLDNFVDQHGMAIPSDQEKKAQLRRYYGEHYPDLPFEREVKFHNF